jgi:hypothetical protein
MALCQAVTFVVEMEHHETEKDHMQETDCECQSVDQVMIDGDESMYSFWYALS